MPHRRRERISRWIWTLVAASLVASLACQVVVSLDAKPAPAPDPAPSSSSPNPDRGPMRACDEATYAQPKNAPVNEQELPDIIFALSNVTIASAAPADAGLETCERIAFNIDRKATCWDQDAARGLEECAEPRESCAWGPSCRNKVLDHQCDEKYGMDNALAAAFLGMKSAYPFLPKGIADPRYVLASARANLVLVLSGYNGGPDDRTIALTSFRSSGLAPTARPIRDAATPETGEVTAPMWDRVSLQRWDLASKPPGSPRPGYVSNYVIHVENVTFELPTGGASVAITGSTLVAELREQAGRWHMIRGRIGGVIDLRTMVPGLADFNSNAGGTPSPLCKFVPMDGLRRNLCEYADTASVDGGACDSLSAGVSFTAVPAELGNVRSSGIEAPCPPDVDNGVPPDGGAMCP